jgi:2-iminobutanoate/2-iminopropanoate deaminase
VSTEKRDRKVGSAGLIIGALLPGRIEIMRRVQMKFEKEPIVGAIRPSAPYSPGMRCGPFIFAAATSTDPKTGRAIPGTIEEETQRTVANIARILEVGGSSLKDVVKATVYLSNFEDFDRYNRVYAQYFKQGGYPCRATVQVSKLYGNGKIEIDVIALARNTGKRRRR